MPHSPTFRTLTCFTRVWSRSRPLAGEPMAGQFPPERATNWQVLPQGIPMDSLVDLMSDTLGRLRGEVRYDCHSDRHQ
jgi:hypothetical protein